MSQFIALNLFIAPFLLWPVFAEGQKSAPAQEAVEEEEWTPSLSDALNDASKLKNRVKRQLAKELGAQKSHLKDRKVRRSPSHKSINEVAHFGDFEVSISERGEEPLAEAQKKKSAH